VTGLRVSIVTPSLNQGVHIARSLAAVRRQTYANIEHIVVDGGSTDETLETLRRYQGTYCLKWSSEPDRNMYEAINKGLAQARGDILCYINTDDVYFPWTIQSVVAAFESGDADILFGDVVLLTDESQRPMLEFAPPFREGWIRRSGFLFQPTVFWRRGVFERFGGFDDSLNYVADCEYWMRLGRRVKWSRIDEVLAFEFTHAKSKRVEQAEALNEELALVRARYKNAARVGCRLTALGDSAYAYGMRRWYLLRFVAAILQKSADGPWGHFRSRVSPRPVWWRVAAAFLPFARSRHTSNMFAFDIPRHDDCP
jgi:glycosyltransferase involved in cell wall biosynthesis